MENQDTINKIQNYIDEAKHIVFFSGAGVSTDSGIPDFRSQDGLYNLKSKYELPYEEMLSHHYFEMHTKTFFKFYLEFMIHQDAKPNITHTYLALKERQGKDITIITQNIDGLHTLAGSKKVIELHGSIHQNICTKCNRQYNLKEFLASFKDDLPLCPHCNGLIKPNVVLYEEPLEERNLIKAMIALREADFLIVAGTSLKVYPANALLNYYTNDKVIVINKEPISLTGLNKLNTINAFTSASDIFSKLH